MTRISGPLINGYNAIHALCTDVVRDGVRQSAAGVPYVAKEVQDHLTRQARINEDVADRLAGDAKKVQPVYESDLGNNVDVKA